MVLCHLFHFYFYILLMRAFHCLCRDDRRSQSTSARVRQESRRSSSESRRVLKRRSQEQVSRDIATTSKCEGSFCQVPRHTPERKTSATQSNDCGRRDAAATKGPRSPTLYQRRPVHERLSLDLGRKSGEDMFNVSPLNNDATAAFYEGYMSGAPPLPTFGSSQNLLAAVRSGVERINGADGQTSMATLTPVAVPSSDVVIDKVVPACAKKTVRFDDGNGSHQSTTLTLSAALKQLREEAGKMTAPVVDDRSLASTSPSANLLKKDNDEKEDGEISDDADATHVFTPSNSQDF